jgi:hypothetical protein
MRRTSLGENQRIGSTAAAGCVWGHGKQHAEVSGARWRRAAPAFHGKRISIVQVALGGYKQPQLLLPLTDLPLYEDSCCHVNESGYAIVAQAIASRIAADLVDAGRERTSSE